MEQADSTTTELHYRKEDIVWLGNLLQDFYEAQRYPEEIAAWAKHISRRKSDPQRALKIFVSVAFSTRTLQLDAYRLIFKTPLEDIIPFVVDNSIFSVIATWRLMLGR